MREPAPQLNEFALGLARSELIRSLRHADEGEPRFDLNASARIDWFNISSSDDAAFD